MFQSSAAVFYAAKQLTQNLGRRRGFFGIGCIPTASTGVIETFSRYTRTVSPGIQFYIPFFQKLREVSNKASQAVYEFEAKTKDNIFVVLTVAVQLKVEPEDTPHALYKMDDPASQIHAHLDSEIRSQISMRDLDDLFMQQEEISRSIFVTQGKKMSVYDKIKSQGFSITNVLIRHIDPDAKVKSAMNAINASQRMKDAAAFDAEAKYIISVREAEADRDRKRLQGEGISQQRLAILQGYETGISGMSEKFGLSAKEVVDFVMRNQYLDTLSSIGKSPNCKTLFLNHNESVIAPPSPEASGTVLKGSHRPLVEALTEAVMKGTEAVTDVACRRNEQHQQKESSEDNLNKGGSGRKYK